MQPDELIAVTEGVAPEAAGALCYWRLSGAASVAAIRSAFAEEGFGEEEQPHPPSPSVALRRALREQASTRRLVRPLDDGGYLVVDEAPDGEGGLAWQTIAKIHLQDGRPVASALKGQAGLSVFDAVQDEYYQALHEVSSEDMSGYLSKRVMACDAVSLRDTGGFYFVPRAGMQSWQRVARALRSCSKHMIASIPALAGEEAALAVLDAINAETTALVSTLMNDIASGEVGVRGLRSRAEKAEHAAEKLRLYEGILGARMVGLAEGLGKTRAAIAAAILTADSREEKSHAA